VGLAVSLRIAHSRVSERRHVTQDSRRSVASAGRAAAGRAAARAPAPLTPNQSASVRPRNPSPPASRISRRVNHAWTHLVLTWRPVLSEKSRVSGSATRWRPPPAFCGAVCRTSRRLAGACHGPRGQAGADSSKECASCCHRSSPNCGRAGRGHHTGALRSVQRPRVNGPFPTPPPLVQPYRWRRFTVRRG